MYCSCVFVLIAGCCVFGAQSVVNTGIGVTVLDDSTTTTKGGRDPVLINIGGIGVTVIDDVTTKKQTGADDVTTEDTIISSEEDDVECDKKTHSGCNVTNHERCLGDVNREPRCRCMVGFAREKNGRACIGNYMIDKYTCTFVRHVYE